MENITLKQNIQAGLGSSDFSSDIEKMIVECCLFVYIKKYISLNKYKENNIQTLITSLQKQYRMNVQEMKNYNVSYEIILNYVNSQNISFISATETQLNYIYSLYLDRTKIEDFSINNFSLSTYLQLNCNIKQEEYLKYLHKNVFSVIAYYYYNLMDINPANMKIVSVDSIENNPGKIVYFKITGVENSKIISDIINKKINIPYKEIELSDDLVKIINK